MKRITAIALLLMFLAVGATAQATDNTAIGVNLDALSYSGPFSPRYNVADQVGGNYGNWDNAAGTAAATTNSDGYPLEDAIANLWNPLIDWPAGKFTVNFNGSGTLNINGVNITSAAPGRVSVDPAARGGAVMTLKFTNIDHSNPPSGLVIVPPGVNLADANKWNPAFLKKIAPFNCLRFMDWTHTNNNPAVTWTNRTQTTASGWTGQYGVPWECIIDLANNTAKDVWINIPSHASDTYIQNLAALFAANLNGTSHVYIEYSNEIWNGEFSQQAGVLADSQANTNLTSTNEWARCYQQIAYTDVQIGNTFKAAFGSRASQVRPVFAGQAGNFWGIGQGLAWLQATYGNVNGVYAVAGAPYIMQSYDTQGETEQQILTDLSTNGLAASTSWVQADVAIANQYSIPYVCYEGGNSLTGFNGINTAAKIACQSDPAMGQLYTAYFQMLAQNNVALYNNYAFVSVATKWGGWGCWDSLATVSSPKGDALVAAALAGPRTVGATKNTAPPVAVASYGKLVDSKSPLTYYKFSITFTDPVGVMLSSVSGRPIYVSGPNGYFAYARPKSLSAATNTSSIVGGYRIYPPAATWTSADNGVYTIWLRKNRVEDLNDNFTPGEALGTFTVAITR